MSYTPPQITEEAKKHAKTFFQHAVTVADSRNYDYAIELYLQGLAKDPFATEDGHEPLRDTGLRRMATGGKKPGLIEALKRGGGKKDPIQAMLAAEFMLSKDPLNGKYAEEMVKQADKAELPEALRWALDMYLPLAKQDTKSAAQRFLTIKHFYEKLGDYYETQDCPDIANECLKGGVDALEFALLSGKSKGHDIQSELRNLEGKRTILRGKYGQAEDFRESIKDADSQKELYDSRRGKKGDKKLAEMIEKARAELQENPTVTGKINTLVDLLCQRATADDEAEAIKHLQEAHASTGQYTHKARADDIHIRQIKRQIVGLREQSKTDQSAKQQLSAVQKELAGFELEAFQERTEEYPTDMRLKFEYGRRLYAAKKFDDAIPVFQQAVSDPRNAVRAKYYIGTCFFQKGWHSQAIDIINEALEGYEMDGDQVSKEMHYILARACEESGNADDALKAYNRLVQWDFNYRDVRQRIDKLQGRGE